MKICHITTAHPVDDVRIYHKECISLIEEGFEVELLGVLAPKKIAPQIKLHKINIAKLNLFKRFFVLPLKVNKAIKEINADIYHIHDPELLISMLFLRKKGKTIIYDVHEDVSQAILGRSWSNKIVRKIIAFIFRGFESFVSRKLTAIVAATPSIANRFKGVNSNVTIVNNYPKLSEMIEANSGSNRRKQIVFSGVINKPRGLTKVIQAMELVDAKLVLIGDFSSIKYYQELKEMKGWEKVEYLGFLSREELMIKLSESFAGIVTFLPRPNHINAQPNKMFEYMSAGLPVIASNFPLWDEIISNNNCGICVNPDNPVEIANAINYLLKNPTEAEKKGDNGKLSLSTKYNWENEARKLIELYKRLV